MGKSSKSPNADKKAHKASAADGGGCAKLSARQQAILTHDLFFSGVISMIPRELYRPADEEEDAGAAKYFKHKKLALPSEVKKSISKKKIAEKYGFSAKADSDSDNDAAVSDADAGSDADEDPAKMGGSGAEGGYDNMQTLRERLQAKIAAMKQGRQSKKRPFEPSLPGEGQGRRNKVQKKDKDGKGQQPHSANKVKGQGADKEADDSASRHPEADFQADSGADAGGDDDGGGMDIDFGTFAGDASAKGAQDKFSTNKGKPGTKKQRLERMLESADNRRARLEELRNSGKEGQARLKEENWNDVLKSAQGVEQVDAAKVKKALKRREKDKQKSAAAWGERKKAEDDVLNKRLDKREHNIAARKKGGAAKALVTEDDVKAAAKVGGRNKEKALERNRRPGFEGKAAGSGGAGGKGQFLNSKEKRKESKSLSKSE